MKEKLLAELKKKYTGQLTTKFMDSLAERLAAKVEKEEDIEGVISELDNSPIRVQDLQVEGDRRTSEMQAKIREMEEKLTKPEPKPETKPETPANAIEAKFAELEKKINQREARLALMERAKEKNIPSVLLSGVNIESADRVDEVLSDLEQKATKLKQEMIDQGLVSEPPKKPTGGVKDEQAKRDIEKYKIKKS